MSSSNMKRSFVQAEQWQLALAFFKQLQVDSAPMDASKLQSLGHKIDSRATVVGTPCVCLAGMPRKAVASKWFDFLNSSSFLSFFLPLCLLLSYNRDER